MARVVCGMAGDPIPVLKRRLADELLLSVAAMPATIAARVLEIDDARMSDLRHGRVARFSVERLIRLLAAVDRHVSMTVEGRGREVAWFRILRERRAERLAAIPADEF